MQKPSLEEHLYLEMREAKGPGEKWLLLVVGSELAINGDAGFLQDVLGILSMRQQAIDVTEEIVLVADEEADEELGAVRV